MKKINYFSHDFSARNDTKIITLRRKCGMAGLGIFWSLIEMLYESGGMLDCDDETLENLAYEWRCDVSILRAVIFDCQLFVIEGEKFYSKSVNERVKKIDASRERKSIAGKKGMQKRWGNDNTVITGVMENDNDVIKNDNSDITEVEKPITENNKKINKKIKKEINKEKDISEVDTPDGGETVEAKEKSFENIFSFKNNAIARNELCAIQSTKSPHHSTSLHWQDFIKKFPKQTRIDEAKMAFLNLSDSERENLAKVYSFWLEYWKTIEVIFVPNPYDFLKNRRFLEKIPEKFGSKNPSVFAPKMDTMPKIDDKKLLLEKQEKAEILEFFANLDEKTKSEITKKIRQKFEGKPVKEGDSLWQIEVKNLTKPLFYAEKSAILAESF